MAYIICEKRKGNPKVNVEVCRRKCKLMEECKSYEKYLGTTTSAESSPTVENQAAAVSPNEGAGKEVQAAWPTSNLPIHIGEC